MFETKEKAEADARKKNDERKPNKEGKLVGKYKVYEGEKDGKKVFAVGKSPAAAANHFLTAFGINITSDKKAVVTKMKPKDYLALLDDEELAELETAWASRKAA